MNKELREMLDQIDNKKQECRKLISENKLDEAEKVRNELKDLKKKFDIAKDIYDEEMEQAKAHLKTPKKSEPMDASNVFIKGIKAVVNKASLNNEEIEILNATTMTEGVPEDGGLTVPQDIKTEIKELRRSYPDALENYVNIEKVTTLSGSRVVEKDSDSTPFDNIDEEADFPEMEAPKFEDIKYKVKKKGGTLAVSKELLSDTSENIKAYLKKWVSKKSKVTRNALIIKALDDKLESSKKTIKDMDDLKDIFNVDLDPAFELSSIALMNQDGFNYLDKLKDSDGNYVLQKDPTQPTRKLLFGNYPIIKVSNKTLKTKANKAPLYLGDLKEMITIFDREALSIEFNELADAYWKKDKIGMKVRERLDVKDIDANAMQKAEIDLSVKKAQ